MPLQIFRDHRCTFFVVVFFVSVFYSISHHLQENIQLLTLRTVQLLELLMTRIFTLLTVH